MTKVVGVTGAMGLVGQAFTAAALERGLSLRCFSRAGVPRPDADLVYLNLGSGKEIDAQLLAGCSTVVHLAAHIPAQHSDLAEASRCWQINALGTIQLLHAMRASGVGGLIQTTTANAYAPWADPADENAPMFPHSRTFYLASKIAQDIHAAAVGAELGIEVTTLRLSSVYGSTFDPGVVTRMATKMMRGEAVQLTGRGQFGADFVCLDDVVSAVLLVFERHASGPYNVASGSRSTMAQIAEILTSLTGSEVQFDPASTDTDTGFPAINIDKLKTLGFQPSEIEVGLTRLVSDLRGGATP